MIQRKTAVENVNDYAFLTDEDYGSDYDEIIEQFICNSCNTQDFQQQFGSCIGCIMAEHLLIIIYIIFYILYIKILSSKFSK